MPGYLAGQQSLAIKIVSVFPGNVERGLPTIHALVIALDSATGRPLAILEGGSLTAIRTGAGSGAATDLLARADAGIVALLGSGVQARTQLKAVCSVRRVREVRVYSPDREQARRLAADLAGTGPIPAHLVVSPDPDSAVQGADIICAATTSATPVFDGRLLKPGAHVNAIGSFRPDVQEVDETTVRRALVVVDSREAALAETGDLIIPLAAGAITEDHVAAELGEIVNGSKPGRESEEQITLFKSVGLAVQDVAAAGIVLRNVRKLGLGVKIDL
jgi:ornithine cyclodeaminase/alanine dehydrogenase-like protein (mu-crystallin family)